MKSPTVFVSYSHDSPEHADRVLALANQLRQDGIDCTLDQYESSPLEGWPRWMDRHIRSTDFVLMVCTRNYFRRVMGEEETGKGLGVKWEGKLVYQHLYNVDANARFIPILFEDGGVEHIPTPLQDATYYRVDSGQGYEDLYRRLTNQPRTVKPKLGPRKKLPPRERKPDYLDDKTSPAKPPSSTERSPVPPPSGSGGKEVGFSGFIGQWIVGLRVWYNRLPDGQKAAVIGAVAVIMVGFMGLTGALGGPVVGEVVKTWLARPTPTLTATPTPTATLTFTPTFTSTPTVTLTPTPDCRDFQVLYLEIDLATGTGKKYPDAKGVITLTHNEIGNLGALFGQAILSNANAAGCYWNWEGGTGVSASWKSIKGNTNFSFYIEIPDQVTTIYLKLTIGEQIKLFTIEVQPVP